MWVLKNTIWGHITQYLWHWSPYYSVLIPTLWSSYWSRGTASDHCQQLSPTTTGLHMLSVMGRVEHLWQPSLEILLLTWWPDILQSHRCCCWLFLWIVVYLRWLYIAPEWSFEWIVDYCKLDFNTRGTARIWTNMFYISCIGNICNLMIFDDEGWLSWKLQNTHPKVTIVFPIKLFGHIPPKLMVNCLTHGQLGFGIWGHPFANIARSVPTMNIPTY